jgi:hypothetical protein
MSAAGSLGGIPEVHFGLLFFLAHFLCCLRRHLVF